MSIGFIEGIQKASTKAQAKMMVTEGRLLKAVGKFREWLSVVEAKSKAASELKSQISETIEEVQCEAAVVALDIQEIVGRLDLLARTQSEGVVTKVKEAIEAEKQKETEERAAEEAELRERLRQMEQRVRTQQLEEELARQQKLYANTDAFLEVSFTRSGSKTSPSTNLSEITPAKQADLDDFFRD